MEVMFSGVRVGLREFDTGESNIWPAGGHGPDKFADTSLIFDIHFLGKALLVTRVSRSNSGIKLLDPCRAGREWSGPVFSHRHFVKPRIEVFLAELINIAVAVNLDVVARLSDVDPIKHVKEALPLYWDRQLVVEVV